MWREIFPRRTREHPRASWQSANTRLKCLFSSCCVLKLDVKDSVQFGVEHSHQVDGSYDTEPTGRKWSSKRHMRCFFRRVFLIIHWYLSVAGVTVPFARFWRFLFMWKYGGTVIWLECNLFLFELSLLSVSSFLCVKCFSFLTTIQSLLWRNATTVGLTSLPICPYIYIFFLPFFFMCLQQWP